MSRSTWLTSTLVQQITSLAYDIWQLGWGERNAGNISIWLTRQQVESWAIHTLGCTHWHPLPRAVPELGNQYFLVTASGAFMRKIKQDPRQYLGIIKLSHDGLSYSIIDGFADNHKPTSELITHLMVMAKRKDRGQRVVLHTHANWLTAMSELKPADSESFTKALWRMCSESMMFFPDGVGILPWMLPGSPDIGLASAELAKTHRLILWSYHGVLAAGEDLDDAFGLIETAEKAAQIYCIRRSAKAGDQGITDHQLRLLANDLNLTPAFPL